MGIYRRGGRKNRPLVFLPYLPQNPHFFSSINRKAGTFSEPKISQTFIFECFDI